MEAFAWTIVVILLLMALAIAAGISAAVALLVGDREDDPASADLRGGVAEPPGPSSMAAGPSTDRSSQT
ncbi:MAG: hypothetical protein OEM67_07250 [Thermoleophilia bacterium]|nr:hypothetical protein [Thermoleophilia bacterium]MDH3724712.1 hypothetical protein [Thermoleophilia bacterium]